MDNEDIRNINVNADIAFEISTKSRKSIVDILHAKEENMGRYIFVRFFNKKEYAERFLNCGEIKVNSLNHLRNLESFRMDNTEGQVDNVFLDMSRFKGYEKKYFMGIMPLDDILPVNISPNIKDVYTFCLSCLKVNKAPYDSKLLVDFIKQNVACDKFCVVIYDIQRFMNQIKNAIENKLGSKVTMGLVNYKETTPFDFLKYQDGDLFFRDITYTKDCFFQNEKEFRVSFENKGINKDFEILNIGSLKFYSEIFEIN